MTATSVKGAPVADNVLHGVAFMICGLLILSSTDGVVKYLSGYFSPLVVAFSRFSVHMLIILVAAPLFNRSLSSLLKEMRPLLLLRGLLLAVGSIFIVFALKFLPLTEATALFFIQPVFLVLLSALVLKEDVGLKRWIAVLLGFAGVLVITRPGLGVFKPSALLILGAAGTFACYLMLTRQLSGAASQLAIQMSTGIAGVAVLGPLVLFAGFSGFGGDLLVQEISSELAIPAILLIGLGATGLIAHVFLVKAFERAPASVLAPINYVEIISATLIGYFFFQEVPDAFVGVGALLLVLGGLVLVQAERATEK